MDSLINGIGIIDSCKAKKVGFPGNLKYGLIKWWGEKP